MIHSSLFRGNRRLCPLFICLSLSLLGAQGVRLRFAMKDGVRLAYLTQIKLVVDNDMAGRMNQTRMELSSLVVQDVDSCLKNGSFRVHILVQDIQADLILSGNRILPDSIADQIVLQGRMSPWGDWENLTVRTEQAKLREIDPHSFIYPLLYSPEKVEPGQRWIRQVHRNKIKEGVSIVEASEYTFTMVELSSSVVDGERCHVANIKFTLNLTYKNENPTGPAVEAVGKGLGRILARVDDGTLVSMESTIEVSEKFTVRDNLRKSRIQSVIHRFRTRPPRRITPAPAPYVTLDTLRSPVLPVATDTLPTTDRFKY